LQKNFPETKKYYICGGGFSGFTMTVSSAGNGKIKHKWENGPDSQARFAEDGS